MMQAAGVETQRRNAAKQGRIPEKPMPVAHWFQASNGFLHLNLTTVRGQGCVFW